MLIKVFAFAFKISDIYTNSVKKLNYGGVKNDFLRRGAPAGIISCESNHLAVVIDL